MIQRYSYILLFVLSTIASQATGQIGVGVSYGIDLYQYYENPIMPFRTIQRGTGSALFNLNIGPKVWLGGKDISIGFEGQIGIAPFALDVNEYKGLGAFYFPVMASLNFKGLSGFAERGGWGFGLAAGMQFTRTDLYFLKEEYGELNRSLFKTIFGQLNIGLGSNASSTFLYVRYGVGDEKNRNFHIGVMLDQNLTQRKKIRNRNLD